MFQRLMNRERIDAWCERGILGLVLAILVWGPLATGAVRTLGFLVIEVLTLGVMALWGARLWLQGRVQLLWPPVCWAVLAFAVYAIARYFTADIEYIARQELLHILVYGFLFFAILNNLHRQESMQIISFTLIFLALAIAFYAVYQFLTGSDRVWHLVTPYKHRGTGTYINPNHLGGFLELLLPLALAYMLIGRLRPVSRVLLGYAALVMLAGIGVTISRGAWLSTAVALLLLFSVLLVDRNYRLPALALLLILVGGGTVFGLKSFSVQQRVKQLLTNEGKVNDNLRFAVWRPALRMWQDHFWCGAGPGHFNARFGLYRPEVVQKSPIRAHNDYLNALADWGVIGTTILVGAWVLVGWGIIKTWPFVRRSSDTLGKKTGSNRFAFVLGAALGLAAILVHSTLDFNLHIPANAILALTLMALLSSHLRFASERFWCGLRPWSKALTSLVLLAGLVFLSRQGWRQGVEYVWLDRAARAAEGSPEQAALLGKAFAAEPMNGETAFRVGEAYRLQSFEGTGQAPELARQAMSWYERSMKLNRWDARSRLRYAMCLDWVGRTAEAAPFFAEAERLDPNNYFILAHIGWHYVNLGDFAGARPWLERSLRLEWENNLVARNYLQIAETRLLESATNELRARLNAPR